MGINNNVKDNIIKLLGGELPFDAPIGQDSYMANITNLDVTHQVQLSTAFKLQQMGDIDKSQYDLLKDKLSREYEIRPNIKEKTKVKPTFSPWAPNVGKLGTLPPGWELVEGRPTCVDKETSKIAGVTGKILETKKGRGRKAKAKDPTRATTGRFLPGVAEVWFYNETGLLECKPFFGQDDSIDRAWCFAHAKQEHWDSLIKGPSQPCVWVKYRVGESNGNKWVLIATAKGYILSSQEIVRLHQQAKGTNIAKNVGEKSAQTKSKYIELLLEQNKDLSGVGCDLRNIDIPVVEPEEKQDIKYTIRFQSGFTREVNAAAASESGDITGHRKRAYKVLLYAPCGNCDNAATVKYEYEGKTHIVSRGQALAWAESQETDNDHIIVDLEEQFNSGKIDASEYIAKKGSRLNEIDPPAIERPGTLMKVTQTRVEYQDGRMSWQRAKTDSTPGSRWVGSITGGSNWDASIDF